jgi:hypothetical protein
MFEQRGGWGWMKGTGECACMREGDCEWSECVLSIWEYEWRRRRRGVKRRSSRVELSLRF